MNDEFKNPSSQTLVVSKVKEKKPKLYKVILLNDDYTPMEYVVKLLREVFRKTENDAKKGSGVCGIFTKEIAETKVFTVTNRAKSDQHPLKCIMEPE
jgi:ATP-dependent Clp protease adaptor protein ClpS